MWTPTTVENEAEIEKNCFSTDWWNVATEGLVDRVILGGMELECPSYQILGDEITQGFTRVYVAFLSSKVFPQTITKKTKITVVDPVQWKQYRARLMDRVST